MSNNPKQIVNLSDQLPMRSSSQGFSPSQRKPASSAAQRIKPDPLDEMYEAPDESRAEPLRRISRPASGRTSIDLGKVFAAVFMIAAIGIGGYFFFGRKGEVKGVEEKGAAAGPATAWYLVKLTDNEIFYGQIGDLASNPLKVENVYYNYDKDKPDDPAAEAPAGLRLVKRGKEAHGPSGEIVVFQSQVVYLEPLRDDSKVLNAIKEYEK
jgi:hypothetical protein